MVMTRQIQLDPEADRILESVSADYGGDISLALADVLKAHQSVESFVDEMEATHAAELIRQRDRSERDFAGGRNVSWAEVKRQNGL